MKHKFKILYMVLFSNYKCLKHRNEGGGMLKMGHCMMQLRFQLLTHPLLETQQYNSGLFQIIVYVAEINGSSIASANNL